MTASSAGNEAKGGKQPVIKAGKTGARKKGLNEEKTGGAERQYERKDYGKIDQIFKKSGNDLERKKEDGKSSNTPGLGTDTGYDKKNLAKVLQQIIHQRAEEIREIETKIDTTGDERKKATLGVHLKGVQRALKEALVNLSLAQRNEGISGEKGAIKGDEEKNEEVKDKKQGVESNKGADDMDVEDGTKLTELTIHDEEMEFYVDQYEESSEDEEVKEKTEKKHNHKKQKKEKEMVVVDLTMVDETNIQKTRWGDMSDDDTVPQNNTEDNNNGWLVATNKKHKKTKESNNSKQGTKEENEYLKGKDPKTSRIANPYYKTNYGPKEKLERGLPTKTSLASYAEAATKKTKVT